MRGSRVAGTLLWLVLAAVPAGAAEVPYLLANINREPFQTALRGEPSGFFELGGRLLFSTADFLSLDQGILWSTDGTARGTIQLSTSLCASYCKSITPLGTWRGVTLLRITIQRDLSDLVDRLGRTDGTAAGTFLLTGDLPYDEYLNPLLIHVPPQADGFFFSSCFNGPCQLWRSDGTRAGTAIFQGIDSLPFVNPRSFTTWRDRLYFVASRGEGGEPGLWSTDGSREGTRFIHEARDFGDPRANPLVATPSHLFFTSGEIGEDLWVTDGSPEGTRLLADFTPPPCDRCAPPDVYSMTATGDEVYFEIQRPGHHFEIWGSDGTGQGTRPLIELPARIAGARNLQRVRGHWLFQATGAREDRTLWTIDDSFTRASPLTGCAGGPCPEVYQPVSNPAAGVWLFTGYDGQGLGLWGTDGTAPGTWRLAGVCPDFQVSPDGLDIFPDPHGMLYFRACPPGRYSPEDAELWVTDGTSAGTHRAGGHFSAAGFLNGLAYFGSSPVDLPASELWATDGTPGQERRITTLRRYRPGSNPKFHPFRNGAIFATSKQAGQAGLWTSDGTKGGTLPLQELSQDFQWFFGDFLGLGNPVQLFTVYRQQGDGDPQATAEIWRTDGTSRGTRSVAVLPPLSFVEDWLAWNGKVLFVNYRPSNCSVWSSDGTAAGTREIYPMPPALGCPGGLVAFGSRFLFSSLEMDTDLRPTAVLYISDGRPAGTRRIASIAGRYFNSPILAVGETFFFVLATESSTELWQTDGTPEGTRPALPLSGVSDLHVFRGSLYLTAPLSQEPDGGRGLFRFPPGGAPILLARILRYSAYSLYLPLQFAPADDRLLFGLQDIRSGFELWTTDGTPAGTRRVRGFQPLPGDSFPQPEAFVSSGHRVFFAAGDGLAGRELWESDGTPEGTRMLVDMAPGGYSGIPAPSSLALSNGVLYFGADDGKTGLEPWALRLDGN